VQPVALAKEPLAPRRHLPVPAESLQPVAIASEAVDLNRTDGEPIPAAISAWLAELENQTAELVASHSADRNNEKVARAALVILRDFRQTGKRSEQLAAQYQVVNDRTVSRVAGWSAEEFATLREIARVASVHPGSPLGSSAQATAMVASATMLGMLRLERKKTRRRFSGQIGWEGRRALNPRLPAAEIGPMTQVGPSVCGRKRPRAARQVIRRLCLFLAFMRFFYCQC
jgi:hypothetical protein